MNLVGELGPERLFALDKASAQRILDWWTWKFLNGPGSPEDIDLAQRLRSFVLGGNAGTP